MTKAQGYSTAATAKRGAQRQGLVDFTVEKNEADGKWYIHEVSVTDVLVGAADLPAGEHVVKVTDVIVEGGKVKTTFEPVLSEETKAKVEKVHAVANEDLARLAAKLPKPVQSTEEEINERRAERRERMGLPDVPQKVKAPSYKEMARSGPQESVIEKPVQFIHEFLAENFGKRSRKELIAEIVAKGINVSTARTQYQHFKKKKETNV